jgi:uncharacterized protein (DUF58 family)
MITLQNRLLPLLTGLAVFVYLLNPYRGWLFLALVLGGMWGLARLWAKSLALGLRLQREMRFGWRQVGDRLEERFTLINAGFLPALLVEVDYQSSMPDYQPGRATSAAIGGETTWEAKGVCTRRGLYTLGPVTLRAGDPFGVYRVELTVPGAQSLLVAPPVIPLPGIEIAPGGRAGEGRLRRRALEQTASASHVREYLPGDSLRRIHWRTTARRGSLFVREMEDNPASDWWILVDLEARLQRGAGFATTDEHAIILAASLAVKGLRAGQSVGLALGGREFVTILPRHGEEQRQAILHALALASPGMYPLAGLLARAGRIFRHSPSLIIITASPEPGWVQALAARLGTGIVPTVMFLDPATYPGAGAPSGEAVLAMLADFGVARHVFPSAAFNRPEARPGTRGHWGWSRARSNRAVLKDAPGDLEWKQV